MTELLWFPVYGNGSVTQGSQILSFSFQTSLENEERTPLLVTVTSYNQGFALSLPVVILSLHATKSLPQQPRRRELLNPSYNKLCKVTVI